MKEINFRMDLGGVEIVWNLFSFRKAVLYSHVIECQPLEAFACDSKPALARQKLMHVLMLFSSVTNQW